MEGGGLSGGKGLVMKRAFLFLVRWGIGLLFLYAGAVKIADPSGFARAVEAYRILPSGLIPPFSHLLPWVEVLVGAALLSGLLLRGAALLSSSLFLLFAVAIGVNLVRGAEISCGCFTTSPHGEELSLVLLLRDVVLFLLSLFLLITEGRGSGAVDGSSMSRFW